MFHRCLVAAAALAAGLAAPAGVASAADLAVAPPAYAPPVDCVAIDRAPPKHGHRTEKAGDDYVRIFDVAPYDPRCPQRQPQGIYVPPQQAYLVSSPTRYTECIWPCADAIHHDWYDGRLWYHNAGTPNRPDVFMILKRD
jgi:hypothetical protein